MGRKYLTTKIAIAVIPIAFALYALLSGKLSEPKLDNSVIILVALGVLVLVVPWEKLIGVKVAGVEFALDNQQINKALGDLKVLKSKEHIDNEKVWTLLRRLTPEIEQVKGSRLLWIDDSPDNVLGERRLLRGLNIETVMATSSEMADQLISTDGDFDLIISDLRSGEDYRQGKSKLVEAVRFIMELRASEEKRQKIKRYAHIPSLPVIFYSGKDYERQRYLTESVRDPYTTTILTRGVEKLLLDVIRTLSDVRSKPIRLVVGTDQK